MVAPVISPLGRSFKGAFLYYSHDKDKKQTTERVGATFSINLGTDNPDTAWRIMAYTAKNAATLKQKSGGKATGRKPEFPVFSMAIPWHPEQKLTEQQKIAAAKSAIQHLGLSDYQVYGWIHKDTAHPHIHVVANRVHPITGKLWDDAFSQKRIQAWALKYQRERGERYCPQRDANARARDRKEQTLEYGDPVIRKAWEQSDTGRAFVAALQAAGYRLAQGNKRLVIMDKWGKVQNPVRHLKGLAKAKDLHARLRDVSLENLPAAPAMQRVKKAEIRREYTASRKFDAWATQLKNETQTRHIEERARLSDDYHRRIFDKKAELEEFYKIAEKKREIARLNAALKNPSLLRRVTGKAAADRDELERQKNILGQCQQHMTREINTIEYERTNAFENQQRRQQEENQRVNEVAEQKRPDFYRDEELSLTRSFEQPPPERAQERGRGRTRERGLDSPG